MIKFIRLVLIVSAMFLPILGCTGKPPNPVATPDLREAQLIEDLYASANDPNRALKVLDVLKERSLESQKTTIGDYIDGYLQRRGFGLGPERMELLKGLLAMYISGIDVDEVMDISRELPKGGNTEFAYLPERTIVVLANETSSIWDIERTFRFSDGLARMFLETGIETNLLNSYVRSLEIRDFLMKLERSADKIETSSHVSQEIEDYINPKLNLSIDHPYDWTLEEIQDGFGMSSPSGSPALLIIKIDTKDEPSETIASFLESAKGGNPNLITEDSQFTILIKDVDDVSGIRTIKHYSYPTGEDTNYYSDIVVIKNGEFNWLLLITSYENDSIVVLEELNKIVMSLRLK